MAHRLALLLALLALAIPPAWRGLGRSPAEPPAGCVPGGRGAPPRHWLGCRTDAGPRRGLADEERLLLGLPLDPNRASARALAFVPGLTPRLARAVVADRAARGPFLALEDLDRVPGIGPGRLGRARSALAVPAAEPDGASRR